MAKITPSAKRAILNSALTKVKMDDDFQISTWKTGEALGAQALRTRLYQDLAIGIGGLPQGRFSIYHGPSSCGKTSAMWLDIAACQDQGGIGFKLDFERKDELGWAQRLGVVLEDTPTKIGLQRVRAKSIEHAFDGIEKVAKALRDAEFEGPIYVGWDSLQAAGSNRTFDAGHLEGGYSPESGAYSRGFRIAVHTLEVYQVTLVAVSQVRANVGAMGAEKKTKIGVGNACGHHAVAIAEFKLEQKNSLAEPCQFSRGTWVKNQLADPFGTFLVPIVYGKGPDILWSDFLAAQSLGMVEAKGAWYTIDCGDSGTHRVNGLKGMRQLFAENPEYMLDLQEKARDFIGKEGAMEVNKSAMKRVQKYGSPEAALDKEEEEGPLDHSGEDEVVKRSEIAKEEPEEAESPKRGRGRGK